MDWLETARELIRIDAPTGREEPCVAYLERVLRGLGVEVRSQEVAPGRRNLVAGPPRPDVLFCTHTDTVPPALPFREDDECLWGRGACDTRGIAACMLEAGRRLRVEGHSGVGWLFVVGEEVDNIGAQVANRTVRAGHVIVGEPTENRLAVGHKGFLSVRIRVRGTACHSAYPERGDSAVHRLLGVLERIRAHDFGSDPVLGEPSVNVGTIQGGVAPNVLAAEAEAWVALRLARPLEEAERALASCASDPVTGSPDPRVELEWVTRMPSPELVHAEGFPTCVVSFGTDAPFLRDVGRILLYGPGSVLDAHGPGEKVSKRSLEQAVGDYVALGRTLIEAEG